MRSPFKKTAIGMPLAEIEAASKKKTAVGMPIPELEAASAAPRSEPSAPHALTTLPASLLALCDPRLVSLLHPASVAADQYRCLRYSLLRTLTGGKCNVIAVSSPSFGGDKTITAINLAAALEELGVFRVLLVDADLREAAVAGQLALEPVANDGLDAALTDWSVRLGPLVRRFPQPSRLGVLPTAAQPSTAGRLIASPRMGMLIGEARQHYDFVILDAPPLLPTADCRAMAAWVDGFVVVVDAHRTERKLLEEALNVMRPDQVLGLVFSGDDGAPWFPDYGFDVGD